MPTASPARPLTYPRRGIGLVAVLAALIAALALVPSGASARGVPASFLGVTPNDQRYTTYDAQQLRQEKGLGIGTFRQLLDWSRTETSPGHYDFTITDRFVLGAAHKGVTILPILFNAPAFRARIDPAGRIAYPPRSNGDLGRFAAKLVQRYGPRGTIWHGRDARFRKYGIHSWQIWNEPNLRQYWGGHPNAAQYTRMLRDVGRAIKHADRHAEIVTAGIPQSTQGGAIPLSRYLPQLLHYRAQKYFTTLAANAYSHDARGIIRILAGVRKTLNRAHSRANIWLTEFGWSDAGPRSQFRLGSSGQSRQLNALILSAAKERNALRLRGFIYYNWQDFDPSGRGDFVGNHMGLVNVRGRVKRAFDAFSSASRRVRR